MIREYQALIGRINIQLSDIEQVINRAEMLREKAAQSGDDGYWDGVALNLHSYYAGVEHIFEDIGRTVEVSIPTGPDWHRDLLTQMMMEFPKARPAVISQETRECLDEYRGFRHVVRNVYTFNLRPSRLNELVLGVRVCYNHLQQDLKRFNHFLKDLSESLGETI